MNVSGLTKHFFPSMAMYHFSVPFFVLRWR